MDNDLQRLGLGGGILPRGKRNSLADVAGLSVGHVTLSDGPIQTGVTAVIPAPGNLFCHKLVAACEVLNGFGKSAGLVQIAELGTLETPVVLTNTLSVGDAWRGLLDVVLEEDAAIGADAGTVNPVVCECNDGFLNDIRALAVTPSMVGQALKSATPDFALGAVGAGRAMSCYQLKGGIGTSSRRVETERGVWTLGALVLSNYGELKDLIIGGQPVGQTIAACQAVEDLKEQGSIIVVLATDAPMTSRQLNRLCRRAGVGITRSGSWVAHGSGEIALAFSTAQRVPHDGHDAVTIDAVSDNDANLFFRATVEAVHEAVLSSLVHGTMTQGFRGRIRYGLRDYANLVPQLAGLKDL